VAADSEWGPGMERMEIMLREEGLQPCIKYCFNRLNITKIFLMIRPINIV